MGGLTSGEADTAGRRKTNEFIEAHLECERVELTYFETYPYLGVKLTNGRLISHQAEDSIEHQEDLMIPSDSLLSFKKAIVVFNPTDYLFSGKVTIPRVIMIVSVLWLCE